MLHLLHLKALLGLFLLLPANAFMQQLNQTLCCETALLASETNHDDFPLNFHLWNSLVGANDTLPPLLPIVPANDVWNALVQRRRTQSPQEEYLDFRCGVTYSSTAGSQSPAAMAIRVPLVWARQTPACKGFIGVPLTAVDMWAGPLVGFLLPSIVFGLSIPSAWALTDVLRTSNVRDLRRPSGLRRLLTPVQSFLGPVAMFTAFLVLGILEILRWAIVILTCPGPILSSTLQEMQLNKVLLSQLALPPSTLPATELRRRRLVLAILLGNISDPNGNLSTATSTIVLQTPASQMRTQLGILLAANTPFDVAIGAPVAFYAVAYAYALFDAYQRLGDHLTATALTFGLWYSEFALVAVLSGCLLGCTNTAIIEGVIFAGPLWPRANLGAPWNRGQRAHAWATWADPQLVLTTPFRMGAIAVTSIVLVSIPSCLALLVSYRTPGAGLGCRSMSITLYYISQVVLVVLHTVHSSGVRCASIRTLIYVLLPPTLLLSLMSALGGTVLQITGLYLNIYCLAGVRSFSDPDNPAWWLDLATDTALVRQLARYRWLYSGAAGLVFLYALCAAAWWYQKGVKKQCESAIATLGSIRTPAQVLGQQKDTDVMARTRELIITEDE